MRTLCYVLGFLLIGVFADSAKNVNQDVVAETEEVEKTRLIKVDYTFETESVLYDDIANKDSAASFRTEGNFTFQTLHYDMEGNILARFEMTECRKGPCNDLPPVLMSFSQGGNNLEGAYIDTSNHPDAKPTWNVLWGIASSIYTPALHGEGDKQVVPTVFGTCNVHFSRPEDKKFKRIIDNCELGNSHFRNSSMIGGLEVAEYRQEALYKQNTKVDADIVIIEAVELAKLRNPLDSKIGFQFESRLYIQITNRTRLYVPRPCALEVNTHNCALLLKGKQTGTRLYEGMSLLPPTENKFASVFNEYRNHLYEMGDSHTCDKHSLLFAKVVFHARELTESDWKNIILNPENEPVLHVVGNILGSLGTETALKVAREQLLIEGPSFIDDYLFSAALSLSKDHSWHKKLVYWLTEESGTKSFWKIANTVSSILYKKCEESPSSINSCNKGKTSIVNKFLEIVTNSTDDEWRYEALNVLYNLPITGSYQYAKKFICNKLSTSKQQTAALKLVKRVHHHQYDSQLGALLVKVFRNTCVQFTPTKDSQLAVDILLKYLPEHENIGTHILRTESLYPQNPEVWQYLYRAVLASNLQDELKEEYWNRMRSFKIFRTNYLHKSLKADSNVNWSILNNIAGFNLEKQSSVEFDDGIFKRTDFDISLKKGKKINHHLFGLSISSSGVDSFVRDSSSNPVDVEPEASVRLSILNHALPEVSVFKGTTGMMSAVWNADGQTLKAFEGNAILRDALVGLPLLSGMTAELVSMGAASIKLLGSCEISLWNKESSTSIAANVSISFLTSAKLLHGDKVEHSLSSTYSATGSLISYVDASFNELPPSFCMRVERSNMELRRTHKERVSDEVKKNTQSRLVYPGVSLYVDNATTKQCNVHAKKFEQY
ncbi:unnamed protein product [Auanema sp. JU1783]|nr:unnamed protein product [Auanema sp. JU1783]